VVLLFVRFEPVVVELDGALELVGTLGHHTDDPHERLHVGSVAGGRGVAGIAEVFLYLIRPSDSRAERGVDGGHRLGVWLEERQRQFLGHILAVDVGEVHVDAVGAGGGVGARLVAVRPRVRTARPRLALADDFEVGVQHRDVQPPIADVLNGVDGVSELVVPGEL